jgi:hypothetical protein
MTPEHFRALSILAGSPDGCTESMMLAHGFTVDFLTELVLSGLATATVDRMIAGRKQVDVTRVQITEAGRRLYQGGLPGGLRDG